MCVFFLIVGTKFKYTLPAVEPFMGVLVNFLNLSFGRSVESALFWRSMDSRRPAVKVLPFVSLIFVA